MPFNGSGTFTLAQPAFVPSTVISSSAMNSDLSDIATNGLTNVVAKDGQTTITGAFKGFTGSVGVPMYSFSADTDSGMYRIGANNIGLSVNATKILDIATTGLSVIGALSATTSLTVTTTAAITGQSTLTGGFLSGDGTVMLPAWSFTSDPDSGVYRIGANNIGVAVNAAKVLDIGTTGLNVIGSVSSNGTPFTPQAQAVALINGTIVESHTGNAATFAIKTLAGADPSATDIVYVAFRNVTAATGNYVVLQITAALSLTLSSGSTMGFSSGVAGKLWFVLFNDASTVRIGAINCLSGTSVYPLGQFPIATSTAEGGAGGADSAQVFYTGTAVTSKAYSVIGYASYETGLASAGAWASSPTRLQLFGDGVPLPGTVLNPQSTFTGAVNTGSTVIPNDDTIPQITEGNEYMTQAITPTSAAHVLSTNVQGFFTSGVSATIIMGLFRDSTVNALVVSSTQTAGTGNPNQNNITWMELAGQTTSTTYRTRAGGTGGTTTFNGAASARKLGGVMNSYMIVSEIVT